MLGPRQADLYTTHSHKAGSGLACSSVTLCISPLPCVMFKQAIKWASRNPVDAIAEGWCHPFCPPHFYVLLLRTTLMVWFIDGRRHHQWISELQAKKRGSALAFRDLKEDMKGEVFSDVFIKLFLWVSISRDHKCWSDCMVSCLAYSSCFHNINNSSLFFHKRIVQSSVFRW